MPDSAGLPADCIVVMAAPNGARRGRADHPAIPLTATEIGECAVQLLEAGASVLHLHVRDRDGRHTLDPDRYRDAIRAVRQRVGDELIVQVTTEAVGIYEPAEQMAVVNALRPEAVSLGLRELCASEADEPAAGRFFASLRPRGIWPQYILYSADDLRRFDRLRREGFFGEDRPFGLLVLGRYSTSLEGSVDELLGMLGAVDTSAFPWAVCCFGRGEHDAALAAARNGGHVRLGFENNLHMADGTLARDNAGLIRQFVESAGAIGRRPVCADDIRRVFDL